MIKNIIQFLTTGIWKIRLEQVSGARSLLISQLRVVLLALRGFNEDMCTLRASALTFYTLLSIVPVAAMFFGIAKGFGFETMLEQQLLTRFPGQEEVIGRIISFARAMLENTRGGLVAGIGIAVLFWTVIKLLGNIENALNGIWGIPRARTLGRKFSDYLSAMLICPLLFIMASSLTVAVAGQVKLIMAKLSVLQVFSPLVFAGLNVLPYAVIWALFSFLYIFMPNTRVKPASGILAGVVAGTLYQAVQWAYISFQVGVSKYNAIYGGFAALPMFLVWLELSWLIVLFGAEVSFAHQNAHTYEFEPDCLGISRSFRRLLSLRVVQLLVKHFQGGQPPLTADDVKRVLGIPVRLTRQILEELVACGVLHEVSRADEKNAGYQPARSIDAMTLRYVVDALERHGTDALPVERTAELGEISRCLESMDLQAEQSAENIRLKDI